MPYAASLDNRLAKTCNLRGAVARTAFDMVPQPPSRYPVTHWHRNTSVEVARRLDTDLSDGLTSQQIAERRTQFGSNELKAAVGRGSWLILWEQLRRALVVMLMIAAGVSAYLNEWTDTVVILAIVLLNAALGFIQDYRAERALAASRQEVVADCPVSATPSRG